MHDELLIMSPKIRTVNTNNDSNVKKHLAHILSRTILSLKTASNNTTPTRNKSSPGQRKQKPHTQESAYAVDLASNYERPFEARLPTFNEAAEIAKERLKLMDEYYVTKNIFK